MKNLLFLAPLLLGRVAPQQQAAPPAAAFSYAALIPSFAQPACLTRVQPIEGTATVSDVVTAANAFLATLTAAQQSTVLQTFNATNVIRWSNFPIAGYNGRIGIRLDALTAAQQAAAMAVVQAATGTTPNEGFNEIQQIRTADDYLVSTGSNSSIFGSNIYFIAFLGQPSTTGTWMLQCGGHHSATNITFGGGNVTGATPKFEGVEPLSFTAPNANVLPTGVTYAPQAQEAAGMLAMISGLTTAQQATAKLTQTFNDIVVGPQKDGQFPATKVGLPCSQLTSTQQQLVMNAMAPWVKDADDATATFLLTTYQNQLANTYIAYSGTGTLATIGDYVRIDGPNVWIEFVVQQGAEFRTQIHYHTLYRDRARDYGGNFYGTYTPVLGTKAAAAAETFAVYPNPTAREGGLLLKLTNPATVARYTVRNTLGQTLATKEFKGIAVEVPTTNLKAGTYVLSLEVDGKAPVTHRFIVK
ncbi:DUF3500 domain-containing protein [Hymenobacter sp. GOD-10R]|uniref:DUF3500 domain-containing protein n=1 Tax=Hymenobacter sp. GOD-10R TaxID=3093922 RepID=UPI002D79DF2A|nr:DUF3500 domain-containing protein [Hymenobacter sp. GOD-10R]WRQ31697.1 DUF3500 domain-containing protein [Hymenobacter sp. GOD-10R]